MSRSANTICAAQQQSSQRKFARLIIHGRISECRFFAAIALLFAASAATTIICCETMATMSEMPMPGGWTMSMAWMRMPGQSWLGAALVFVGMWVPMMVAMMLPSLVPMLWRYRRAITSAGAIPLGRLTTLVGCGYFLVWTVFGIIIFPLGIAVTTATMQHEQLARAAPIAAGAVVLLAGALQFTHWRSHRLACCRSTPQCGQLLPANSATALRYGLRLGLHCCYCCANLTVMLLVVGVMDLRVMAVVTAAITAERLAPSAERVAQIIGVLIVCAGLLWILKS